jgi:O-antigen/teichoic acid export membrane protein
VNEAEPTASEPGMQGPEVRRRAVAGAAVVAVRGAAIRVIGFAGVIVLARLLDPHDFGLIAFGSTLLVFARYLADGGIGAALIRGREGPSIADLQALFGLQLLATGAFSVLAAAIALPFGTSGKIVAVMAASLPAATLRVPGTIVLERELSYGPLVVAEVIETVVYFAWAIGTIEAFGWGVWGLATGAVVRALAAGVAVARVSPIGLPRPTLSWSRVREPLAFGVRFQGVGVVTLFRDQSLNLGTAALGGVSVLGLWGLASKLLSIPYAAFEALWRVGYPAMARLLGSGEDPDDVLERGTALVAAVTGAMLAPLVGAAPALVPYVFGAQWTPAASALPWASLGLMVSGPISVIANGYLCALGDVRAVLRSTAVSWLVLALVAFPLLPSLGITAVGLGAMASSLAEAAMFAQAVSFHSRASIARPLTAPTLAAIAAAAAGWALTDGLAPTLLAVVLGLATAEGLYVGLLLVIRRGLVLDTTGMLQRMVRLTFARA